MQGQTFRHLFSFSFGLLTLNWHFQAHGMYYLERCLTLLSTHFWRLHRDFWPCILVFFKKLSPDPHAHGCLLFQLCSTSLSQNIENSKKWIFFTSHTVQNSNFCSKSRFCTTQSVKSTSPSSVTFRCFFMLIIHILTHK